MFHVSATIRIALGLVCLTVSVLLASRTLGFAQDEWAAIMRGRKTLCESIAVNCSSIISSDSPEQLERNLKALVGRDPELLSAGVRLADGSLLLQAGNHVQVWNQQDSSSLAGTHLFVPILAGDQTWGTVELRFAPIRRSGWRGWLTDPLTTQTLFVACVSLGIYFLYLRKMLSHLDPSRVIPDRVRTAFDTLAEGLLVLDEKERIMLANRAFANHVGLDVSQLQGLRVSELPWDQPPENRGKFPWQITLSNGRVQTGALLVMKTSQKTLRTYRVNTAPILGDAGDRRGVLASFDDVTQLERRKEELKQALEVLQRSREKIRRQNKELVVLATQDPLTGCLNRRSFFERFETLWANAQAKQQNLSCLLFDIDFFKSINDEHGHSMGDEVLRQVSQVVRQNVRPSDLVCRYGGEEFCLVLPGMDIEQATEIAESQRARIEALHFPHLKVTVSLGVTSMGLGATGIQELLDQADKSLYHAKRHGRNQVARWDEVPANLEMDESQLDRSRPGKEEIDVSIPFHAVTALLSALSFRDSETAEHSRRVAELCVITANRRMALRDTYVLEIAALLHDIGKIGVPDAVLFKPGPLSEEEWQVMGTHDRVGVEIISSTFNCPELAEIVRNHHAWFGGNPRCPDLPCGHQIPLGARILSIADAYDAMTSNRVYRTGLSQEAAIVELRRCKGTQFDPELVEAFIDAILSADQMRVPETQAVSKQTALRLGLQMERLTEALDNDDIQSLVALAGRLRVTAMDASLQGIAAAADELEQAAHSDAEVNQLVEITASLLDLCRMTQKAYLESAQKPSSPEVRRLPG